MTATTTTVTLEIVEGPEYRIDEDGWEHNAYTVRLHRGSHTMTTPWRQGLGITDDPTVATVLESLFLDAAGYDNASSFEDWAADYGYDTDSRKAEKLYKQCGTMARKLARFFDVGDHDMAPWMTEGAEELASKCAAATREP